MGNAGTKPRQRKPTEEKSVPGLLTVSDLISQDYDIENLAFANCGADGFSYVGAIRVLEKLCVLPEIKRFSGVGNGAVFATLLAIGLDSKEVQVAFNEHLLKVESDNEIGLEHLPKSYSLDYGWNTGKNFMDWFGELLESRSLDTNLTFLQLYEKTGKELCLLVTNVDKRRLEYLHPKTNPDLSLKKALFMAISIPGIFAPTRYGLFDDGCLHVSASLMCDYPIHTFDGWLLSMDEGNSFLEKLIYPDHFYQAHVFQPKNPKTLGFFPLNKQQESTHGELVNRMFIASVSQQAPRTRLVVQFKSAIQNRHDLAQKYFRLRSACGTLLYMAEEIRDDDGNIPIDTLAAKVFASKSFSRSDRILFPEIGRSSKDLSAFLNTLMGTEPNLSFLQFHRYIHSKMLTIVTRYIDCFNIDINNLTSYFRSIFDRTTPTDSFLCPSDYDRTVGIMSHHVGSHHVNLEDGDLTVLYRQGWNATVCYFRKLFDLGQL